jgi:pyruvate kinase
MNLRKTKIICTMGPNIRNIETLKKLLIAGMNIARFNFSHGDQEYHKGTMEMVREASRQTGIPCALLLDTKGPEIRTGMIKDDKLITLITGNKITLTTETVEGTDKLLSISYKKLHEEITPGKHIFIADGIVDLEVEKVEGKNMHCIIRNGATIGSRKNVNVIGVKTSLPAITEQDVKDIIFGIEQGVDFIAASFIRKPSDVKEIRGIIDICDSPVEVIAKIEDEEGLENIDEIIRVANGVMVARGDLGVQIKTEEIPLVQKRIILKCNEANKPVITATQMLDSMINNPKPTRAESTDVANAIFDGTDAIMLSGETASGKYPIVSVETMHKIALAVEGSPEYLAKYKASIDLNHKNSVADTIAKASFLVASEIHADAIITPTLHGTTPKLISKYRPMQNIIAATPNEEIQRKLLLYWGVTPVIAEMANESDIMVNNALKTAIEKNYVKNFDKVVIVAGIPINSPIMINNIRVHLVCNVLGKGKVGVGNTTSGKIVRAGTYIEAEKAIKGDGTEILLTRYIDDSFKPLFKKIKGYILEEFSSMKSEDIQQINPEIVGIAGVTDAMKTFEDGITVTIDGEEHLIYEGVIDSKKD